MAKERATEKKKKSSKREKKVSDDKVTKKRKHKKRAETPSDTSDDESTGGGSLDVESVGSHPFSLVEFRNSLINPNICAQQEDTPMVDPPKPEGTASVDDKKVKKEKKAKKSKKEKQPEAVAEADDDDATDGGALLFSIDTNPTPVDLATVKTESATGGQDDESTEEDGPKKTKPPSGLNRQARRRIRMIEDQREAIRKKMGIPEGSQDKAEEVQNELDKWTENLDGRIAIRRKRVSPMISS